MLGLIAFSIGEAIALWVPSIIITATLKKAGVIHHLYLLKMMIAYTLISFIGNILVSINRWRIVLVSIMLVLLLGAFLSLMFYLYVLIRSRRE